MSRGSNNQSGTPMNPPLVGRDQELGLLRRAFQRAIHGNGCLVLISGEAGIGKTSLVQRLVTEAREQGSLVLTGGAYDLTSTPPYGPWLELTDRYRADSGLPALPEILKRGTGVGDLKNQLELFEVARDFFTSVSEARPLVLVLEDLHWSDQASLDMLRYLARQIDEHRVLIVATYRDDEITRDHPLFQLLPALVRESQAERIELGTLTWQAVQELVRAHWTLRSGDEARLLDHLLTHAEGHPLFTVEVLRTLKQNAFLSPKQGGWEVADLSQVPVPALVQQVIERRLKGLNDGARQHLEVAAIIGHHVPLDLWKTVAGMIDDQLLDVAEQAVTLNLLEASSASTAVSFVHALTREALVEGVLPLRRRNWHRHIADVLAETSTPISDTVAYHYQQADDPRAVEWLIRAGLNARRSAAWVSAAHSFTTAAMRPGDPIDARVRGWLLFYSAFLLRFSQDPNVFDYLDRAEQIAREAEDPVLAAYIEYHRGATSCMRGDVRRGLTWIENGVSALDFLYEAGSPPATERIALNVIRSVLPEYSAQDEPTANESSVGPDGRSAVTQRGVLVNWLAQAGRYREALPLGEQFVADVVEALGESHIRVSQCASGRLGLAHAYAAAGQPENARIEHMTSRNGFADLSEFAMVEYACWTELYLVNLTYFTDWVQERKCLESTAREAWKDATGIVAGSSPASRTEFEVSYVEGRWAHAREHARLMAQSPRVIDAKVAKRILGYLDRDQGQPDQAWNMIRQMLPNGPATEPGDGYFQLDSSAQRLAIRLSLDAGDLDLARRWLRSHDDWLDWSGSVIGQAESLLLWGELHRADGDRETAFEYAQRALERANEPRQPMALIAIDRFLGELYTQSGDFDAAAEVLQQSRDLVEACAIPFERALTMLAQAELEISRGHPAEVREFVTEVRRIASELGAQPTLERAERLAGRLGPRRVDDTLGLSPRELEVLQFIVQGKSNREIAEVLFISPRTVTNHVSSILRKLDVDSRTAAATRAVRKELV
jgi:DNA-binding CsgD family transcriptional regulator